MITKEITYNYVSDLQQIWTLSDSQFVGKYEVSLSFEMCFNVFKIHDFDGKCPPLLMIPYLLQTQVEFHTEAVSLMSWITKKFNSVHFLLPGIHNTDESLTFLTSVEQGLMDFLSKSDSDFEMVSSYIAGEAKKRWDNPLKFRPVNVRMANFSHRPPIRFK